MLTFRVYFKAYVDVPADDEKEALRSVLGRWATQQHSPLGVELIGIDGPQNSPPLPQKE